ncbi:hypothetical protein ACTXJX_18550, partial [Glutamicibacter ardleyensis]|uniref:hypothetical protein n=1 Tax=Glutamicibacter ardleyensis TaxID=225894 RepID=UPI003FD68810
RVPAGTEADNFVAEDTDGRQWFVKVYRDRNTIDQDQSAVDLAMFACAGGSAGAIGSPHHRRSGYR